VDGVMYNSDTDLLFPLRVINSLSELRGESWADLIDRVENSNEPMPQAAFVLMMVRLGGCVGCNADSFRAMRGCTQCARQSVKRFRGSDFDLTSLYEDALKDVIRHFEETNA
jgi:hypothetical protein